MADPKPGDGRPTRRSVLGGAAAAGAALWTSGCTPVARQVGQGSGGGERRGGKLVMAQIQDANLPTLRQHNLANFSWARLAFNTLTEYDHKTLTPKPQLATGWEESDSGRTIRMRLRDDVRFHSGRPFGPEDVIEMVKYQASEEGAPGQLRSVAAAVKDAEATGPHEVTLRLEHGLTNFFDLCEIMLVFDHESLPELEAGKELNGTGPFVFEGYDPGVAMRFRRNEEYWRPGRPYLDAVEMRVIAQQQAISASLQSGQTHLSYVSNPLYKRNLAADERLRLVEVDTRDGVQYVACNVERPPLDDKRVRQAIAWSVDREKLRDMALAGAGRITSTPWSPSNPAYDERTTGHYRQDLEKARRLVREAGAVGERLEITINGNELGGGRSVAEIVQDGLRAIGLETFINPLQAADFQQRLNTASFPALFVNGHGFAQLNPATLLNGAYPFNAQKNASNFVSERYRELADRAWKSPDERTARRVYQEVTELLLDEQFVVDLAGGQSAYVTSKSLHGIRYDMFNLLMLDDAYLAEV